MSASDLNKASFPSHDTAGYVGFANLPNQVIWLILFIYLFITSHETSFSF